MQILKNKWFWILVALIVLLLLLRKYWTFVKRYFQPLDVSDPTQQGADQKYKDIAQELRNDIEGISLTHSDAPYEAAYKLNNDELYKVAAHYKKLSGGDSLYEDIKGEVFYCFVKPCIQDKLTTRLEQIGITV